MGSVVGFTIGAVSTVVFDSIFNGRHSKDKNEWSDLCRGAQRCLTRKCTKSTSEEIQIVKSTKLLVIELKNVLEARVVKGAKSEFNDIKYIPERANSAAEMSTKCISSYASNWHACSFSHSLEKEGNRPSLNSFLNYGSWH